MLGKQRICILCRIRGRPAQVALIARREASSRSRQDTFDASKLVLDLDAADSKYVRRYEDQIIEDSKPFKAEQNRMLSPIKKANRRKEEAAMLWRQNTIPDIYKATDADYLAFALLGDPFERPSCYNSSLRAVLSKNLVFTRVGSFERKIRWLTDNADRPKISSLADGLPLMHQNETYLSMILDCRTFPHLSRATTYISRTAMGCEWVSSNGDVIVEAIKTLRRAQGFNRSKKPITAAQILKYINALVQRLETMDLHPGPALCQAGMYYAAKLNIYSAVKKYIHMVADNGYVSNKHQEIVPAILVHRYWQKPSGLSTIQEYSIGKEGRRADLLMLLTGWDTDGTPRESEKRKPCLASLAHGKKRMYQTYIASLGKLGAIKALGFELMSPLPLSMKDNESQAMTAEENADLFFNAFVAASDTLSGRVEMELEKDNTVKDVLPPIVVPVRNGITPPGGLKKREEFVAYFQSRLPKLQEDLAREDVNGP